MGKIDELIKEIEDDKWDDENRRQSVDLSDVKRWVAYALEAVKDDFPSPSETPPQPNPKKEI